MFIKTKKDSPASKKRKAFWTTHFNISACRKRTLWKKETNPPGPADYRHQNKKIRFASRKRGRGKPLHKESNVKKRKRSKRPRWLRAPFKVHENKKDSPTSKKENFCLTFVQKKSNVKKWKKSRCTVWPAPLKISYLSKLWKIITPLDCAVYVKGKTWCSRPTHKAYDTTNFISGIQIKNHPSVPSIK